MMAMTAVMLAAMNSIKHKFPDAVLVQYVDDRNWACQTATETKEITKEWENWCQIIGLKENKEKANHYHKTAKGRKKLEQIGINKENITS